MHCAAAQASFVAVHIAMQCLFTGRRCFECNVSSTEGLCMLHTFLLSRRLTDSTSDPGQSAGCARPDQGREHLGSRRLLLCHGYSCAGFLQLRLMLRASLVTEVVSWTALCRHERGLSHCVVHMLAKVSRIKRKCISMASDLGVERANVGRILRLAQHRPVRTKDPPCAWAADRAASSSRMRAAAAWTAAGSCSCSLPSSRFACFASSCRPCQPG